jgi:hypothetical protein
VPLQMFRDLEGSLGEWKGRLAVLLDKCRARDDGNVQAAGRQLLETLEGFRCGMGQRGKRRAGGIQI